jgi:hypothetical protein
MEKARYESLETLNIHLISTTSYTTCIQSQILIHMCLIDSSATKYEDSG